MTLPGIFAVLVGVGMIAQWAMSFIHQQIPELKTEPYRIWFHIVGEMVTAALLILGGAGILLSQPWAPSVYLLAMGMLFYTVIVSPGYFAQKGQWGLVLVFGVLLVLGIASTLTLINGLAG
jgi:hypothetical protein